MNLERYNFIKHFSADGGRVTPLRQKGKESILKDWPNMASNEPNQIDDWFKNTNNNAGILTGKVNRILVIDIDPKNGGLESLKQLENEIGPIKDSSNYVVQTGSGGYHIYFAYPEELL